MTRGDIPWGRVSSGSCRPKLYSHNAGSFKIFFRTAVVAGWAGVAATLVGRACCDLGSDDSCEVVLRLEVDTSLSADATREDSCTSVSGAIVLHGLEVGGANAAPLFARRNTNAATEIFAIVDLIQIICSR